MKNINIYLIRHGQSEINAIPDMIGQEPGTKLTTLGITQSISLGKRLSSIDFDEVLCSDFERAKTTCHVALTTARSPFAPSSEHKKEIYYSADLVEYNPGDWKGTKRSDMYSKPDVVEKLDKQHMGFLFPNGESLHQVERRASSCIENNIIYNKKILELAETKDLHIGIFSHGQTIKCILHYIMGFDQSFLWKIYLNNTSITHVIYNDKGWFLKSINDIAHLK